MPIENGPKKFRIDNSDAVKHLDRPLLIIIAGPNGVGKSTLAEGFLAETIPYINGDELKRTSKLKNGVTLDQFSLRFHIRELINEYVRERRSFAMESNLVSNYSYEIVAELSKRGYLTRLIYLGVDDINLLNDRINERVQLGKHYVSPADVQQRYSESLSKLPINLRHFDQAIILDNSKTAEPIQVLQLQEGIIVSSGNIPNWLKEPYKIIERLSRAYETGRGKEKSSND